MRSVAVVLGFACASFGALLGACFLTIDDSKIRHDGSDAAIDASVDGAIDAAIDASLDGASDALDGACPPRMIEVPIPGDSGAHYCIDETEATLDDYGAFIDAAEPPAPGSQPPACAWNTSFKPPGWGTGSTGNRAVGELERCDAFAFCKWAGKRLCGRIGGGSVDSSGATKAPESQWFNACSRGGTRVYPYGDSYDAAVCAGDDYTPTPTGPLPVRTATGCVGGYDGIFDMSDNVGEFIDSCSTDKLCDGGPECELCWLVGGGFHDPEAGLRCAYVNQVKRKSQYDDNGVRCCTP